MFNRENFKLAKKIKGYGSYDTSDSEDEIESIKTSSHQELDEHNSLNFHDAKSLLNNEYCTLNVSFSS